MLETLHIFPQSVNEITYVKFTINQINEILGEMLIETSPGPE